MNSAASSVGPEQQIAILDDDEIPVKHGSKKKTKNGKSHNRRGSTIEKAREAHLKHLSMIDKINDSVKYSPRGSVVK